jgi:2-(1,2-epoxy-1,2-dihydrophenyl)acetyl-CoA isomerase
MSFLKILNQNQVSIISINRPDVYNALSREAKLEMIKAIREADRNPDVKVIIITGEGKAFCTGQDLNDPTIQNINDVDLGRTLETEWNPLVCAIRDAKKIVIAAVNGVAAGAGVSVALACDLIIANPKVNFVSGFAKVGLSPDCGAHYILSRHLGHYKTMEFFLTNRPLSASDLHARDLINTLSENPLDEAIKLAQEISLSAPLSCEFIKKNLHQAMEISFNESIERETSTQRFLGLKIKTPR